MAWTISEISSCFRCFSEPSRTLEEPDSIPKANPTAADANLVGAFFANGDFSAGTTGTQTDKQLVIYGSVAADAELLNGGSVITERDLGNSNSTSPAVAFIWNPFLILNAPQPFTDAVMDWREVAP